MRNFEVIPIGGERAIPVEQSWAWRLDKIPGLLSWLVKRILGESKKRIIVQTALYANPGKCFHWDVLAKDREDLDKVIKANWLKLTVVMALFGETFASYRTIGD